MNDKYFFGLAWDKISENDLSLEFLASSNEQFPDLPSEFLMLGSPIKDQMSCGACTSFWTTTCHEIQNNWEHKKVIVLDAYKLWAKQVNNPLDDYKASCQNGDYISHAVDILVEHGSETIDGQIYKSKGKARIYDKTPYSLKKWLSQGYPLVVGISFYQDCWDSKWEYTGKKTKGGGGHCFCIVWYDDKHNNTNINESGAFVCQNSWGETWGDKGRFYIPYSKISDMLFNSIYTIYDMTDILFIDGMNDVRQNAWYSDAIKWVVDSGIMSVNQDKNFRPEAQITRAELAQVLYNLHNKNKF